MSTATYQEVHTGVAHQACREYQSNSTMTSTMTSTIVSDGQCPPSTLPRHVSILSFIALVSYITAYSLSFGPITWILLSELFPLNIKARAMSLSQAVNWTTNVFVSVTFLDMVHIFSLPSVFGFYLSMSILSLVFVYFYVPETKNKSLEQISQELRCEDESPSRWSSKHKTLSPLPAVRLSSSSSRSEHTMQMKIIQLSEEYS